MCARAKARAKYLQRGPAWPAIRELTLRRDGYRCLNCGAEGAQAGGSARLEVDHITPLSEGGERYAGSNLRTLCHDCHLAIGGG